MNKVIQKIQKDRILRKKNELHHLYLSNVIIVVNVRWVNVFIRLSEKIKRVKRKLYYFYETACVMSLIFNLTLLLSRERVYAGTSTLLVSILRIQTTREE